jgi:hypothetical protein
LLDDTSDVWFQFRVPPANAVLIYVKRFNGGRRSATIAGPAVATVIIG